MPSAVHFSEAVSMGLHAMALLGADPERTWSARHMARSFRVSAHHLVKVLQRLARAGLVVSVRGPRGGFRIAGDPARITLADVYEAIEGPLRTSRCMFSEPRCTGECIFADLVGAANEAFESRLRQTSLASLSDIMGRFDMSLGNGSTKSSHGKV